MFNAFLHFQTEAAQAQRDLALKQAQNRAATAKKRQAMLLRDYKHTLSQRLQQMSVQPVVRQATNPPPAVRRGFRFTSKDRFERVSEAVTSHACLDPVPVGRRQSVPRERLRAKEIQPELRFRPKDRHWRIREAWGQARGDASWTVGHSRVNPFPNKDPRPFFKTIETLAFNGHVPGSVQMPKAASHAKIADQSLLSLAERVSAACGLTTARGSKRSTSFLK